MKEITLDAVIENVDTVTDFVNRELEDALCPMKAQIQIDVAIDELFSNIAHYAYAPDVGQATVRIEVLDAPKRAQITFSDGGVPYNPLEKADPDVTLSSEERNIGGLGIFMVKKSMDEFTYQYDDGRNIVRIVKAF